MQGLSPAHPQPPSRPSESEPSFQQDLEAFGTLKFGSRGQVSVYAAVTRRGLTLSQVCAVRLGGGT